MQSKFNEDGTPIISGIYRIKSPSNRYYIGQSVNCYDRRIIYKNEGCKSQPRIYNSLKKYGWAAHEWEILEEGYV